MVQIAISFVVALLLATPCIAAPVAIEQIEDIDSRDLTELAPRFHFHLPKIHIDKQFLKGIEKYGPGIGKQAFSMAKMLRREDIGEADSLIARDMDPIELAARFHFHLPKIHIDKQFLKGIEKYGPGIGKQAFKMAKMMRREDIGETDSLIARDMDPIDELDELLARNSPGRSFGTFMKAEEEARKFAKEHHKEFRAEMHATGRLRRSLEDPNIDARDLPAEVYERDYEHEIYERESEESLEEYFGRNYDDFGLEELD